MSLKHGLLGLLNYGPMTGYELDRAFRDSLDFFWHAQTSQIYRELNAMERLGWLKSEIVVQTDRPNKRRYSITGPGRSELQSWLKESIPDSEFRVRSEFLMKLFFSGERSGAETVEMLKNYRKRCEDAAAALKETGGSIERYRRNIQTDQKALYWGITASFGISYIRMCLDWTDRAIKTLEDSK
ncbi:PadR family transcriptional regulator [Ruminococcaceae bacterium BL-6]|nr:PadR family transcriptional regulator [Ruminococcaceae bacterium BL-6]